MSCFIFMPCLFLAFFLHLMNQMKKKWHKNHKQHQKKTQASDFFLMKKITMMMLRMLHFFHALLSCFARSMSISKKKQEEMTSAFQMIMERNMNCKKIKCYIFVVHHHGMLRIIFKDMPMLIFIQTDFRTKEIVIPSI